MPARIAVDAQEPMSEHAAFEIRADLTLHEPGDGRALPSRPSQEGLELLADDFVQKGLFGFVAFVLDGGDDSTGAMRWGALHAKASDVPRQLRREARGDADRSHARLKGSSHPSNGSNAEPPDSRSQRDRMDSRLLAGSRTGPPHETKTISIGLMRNGVVSCHGSRDPVRTGDPSHSTMLEHGQMLLYGSRQIRDQAFPSYG